MCDGYEAGQLLVALGDAANRHVGSDRARDILEQLAERSTG